MSGRFGQPWSSESDPEPVVAPGPPVSNPAGPWALSGLYPSASPPPDGRTGNSRRLLYVVAFVAVAGLVVSAATFYLLFLSPHGGAPTLTLGNPAWTDSVTIPSMSWAPSDTNVSFGQQGGANGANATVGLSWRTNGLVWLYVVNGVPAATNCSLEFPQPSSCGGLGNDLIGVNVTGVGNSGQNFLPLCWNPCTPGPILLFVFNQGATSVSVNYQLWWNSTAPPPGAPSGTVIAPPHSQIPDAQLVLIGGYDHEAHYNWSKGVTEFTGATCVGWVGPYAWETSLYGSPGNPNGSAYSYISGPGVQKSWSSPTTFGASMAVLDVKCWMPTGGVLSIEVWR